MRKWFFIIVWSWKNRHWKDCRHKRRTLEKALTGSRAMGQYKRYRGGFRVE